MLRNISIILFVLVSVKQDSLKTYNKDNFTIKHPHNWELDTSGRMGSTFILFSPKDSEDDSFSENVNLIIQDISAYNLNLNEYTTISENQIKNVFGEDSILFSKTKQSKSRAYHEIIYKGKQNQYNLKFHQYYWVIKNKAYVLTLTCEEKEYNNYKTVGQKILNSFNFN